MLQAPARRLGLLALAALVVTTINIAAPPAAPLDSDETRANATDGGTQSNAAVARDRFGNYVVVWFGRGGGDADGIFFQRYGHDGKELGAETQANTTVAEVQRNPSVAMDGDGNFIIAWETFVIGGDGDHWDVRARRFASDGTPLTGEFIPSATTEGHQLSPSIAFHADGRLVIAWQSLGALGQEQGDNPSGWGVFYRRFDSGGAALDTTDRQANVFAATSQFEPRVAVGRDGNFMISWSGNGQEAGNGYGIFGRLFSLADGAPVSAELHVNETLAGHQRAPDVAAAGSAGSGYVVAWHSISTSNNVDVLARSFDSVGNPTGSETLVNLASDGTQSLPRIAADWDGDYAITWQDGASIRFRLFNAAGDAVCATPPVCGSHGAGIHR